MDWNDDRIAALTVEQLQNLRENAERKGAQDLAVRCQEELTRRNIANPRGGTRARNPVREFERETAAEIARVGKSLAEKHDLSEESARAGSVGVKGFKPHRLLDAKGSAKLGGMQIDGTVAIDRYISYRRGTNTVSLGVFLLKGQPIEEREFHVIAPLALLDGGKPVGEIRPIATPKQKQLADGGLAFDNLEAAAQAFEAVLAKVVV